VETIDKSAYATNEAFDNFASATNQAAESVGEKSEKFKNAEQQLMKNCRSYVRYNPWVSQ